MPSESMIRISSPLKRRLALMKSHEKESYETVIGRLINIAENEPALDQDEIKQIEDSIKDIKAGRVHPFEEGIKKWRH